ncbi:ATP-binding protein [Streptomyces sp. NPDC059568]|uniref:ATP-binding response regulator n=1 Tax=Streptomyces sp. NPDC059568 TaxID=3346868 RepID=UPI0036878356
MRVLVVEDEPHIAAAVGRGLRAEGFGVDMAGDGEQGLLLARRNEYAVIVLDLMLPRRNGYDVCRALRQSQRATVDLDEVVLAEVRRQRGLTATGIDARRVSAGRVRGDAGALRRVVRNLLDNARRHAAHQVRVALTERDGTVELTVSDDGAGIPPADRARVFERFTRLDEARSREAGGSGLGLAIVGKIVTSHGGSVHADEDPSPDNGGLGGARLVIRLPSAET